MDDVRHPDALGSYRPVLGVERPDLDDRLGVGHLDPDDPDLDPGDRLGVGRPDPDEGHSRHLGVVLDARKNRKRMGYLQREEHVRLALDLA